MNYRRKRMTFVLCYMHATEVAQLELNFSNFEFFCKMHYKRIYNTGIGNFRRLST